MLQQSKMHFSLIPHHLIPFSPRIRHRHIHGHAAGGKGEDTGEVGSRLIGLEWHHAHKIVWIDKGSTVIVVKDNVIGHGGVENIHGGDGIETV